MKGSRLLFLASWVILLVLSIGIAAYSALSISRGYFAAGDVLYPTVTLDKIRAAGGEQGEEAVKAFRGRRVTAAAGALGGALLSIAIVLIPYRRGERWAWWALLAGVGISQFLSLARAIFLGTTFGVGAPAIVLAILLLGLLAGAPRMFKKHDEALEISETL